MSKPTPYASTTKARTEAAAEIETMGEDIETTGRHLYSIHPRRLGGRWEVVTITADGAPLHHDGATLDAAYLASMQWPATPPPF